MHIIIDGYNLIRQSVNLRRFERQSLEAGRHSLIASLAAYRRRKGHKITIVFDGWESGSVQEERDYQAGIYIIYSRRGEKADEVIKRIIAHTDEDILVVSSDHEILSYAKRRSKTAISSTEFESIINKIAAAEFLEEEKQPEKDDEDIQEHQFKKKGPAHRLSRAQRMAQTKLKKL